MSLILDALTRAERDKRAATQSVPDLLTREVALETGSVRRTKYLLVLSAFIAATLIAVIVWQLPANDPAIADAAPAVSRMPETSPVLKGEAVPSATVSDRPMRLAPPRRPDHASLDDRGAVAALYAKSDGLLDSNARSSELTPEQAPPVRTQSDREPAAGVPESSGIDAARLLTEAESVAREVASSDGLTPHPAPLLSELSQQFRNSVPTLMYLRHDFDSRGNSTVLLNGDALRQGQRSRGVEVREILADSVILRFSATDFRLRALNSWVNL